MARKCVYCGRDVNDDRSMEICDICGEKVLGRKMFGAIKTQTDEARDKGDLCSTNMAPDFLSEKLKI